MRTPIPAMVLAASLLLTSSAAAAFPGDNGRIAVQGSQRLDTVNSSGGDRQTVIGQAPFYFSQPSWSPDGTRIAFASNREGSDAEIYVISAGGTGIQTLTTNGAEDSAPSWSPDGRRLAFESDRDNPGVRSQIYVMNADGTGVSSLGASPADDTVPAWSPDGTRIAFARGGNVWVTSSAGGTGTPLTSDPLDEGEPDWSPDGGGLVYQRGDGIATMRADGSAQTPLAGAGLASSPVWSPDGTRIAFERDLGIFSVAPDGTGLTPLTTAGTTALIATNPDWQPIPRPVPPPPPPGGGGAPVDADGDGVVAGLDCDDANPGIRPGAKDKPGDRIDQDCAGGDARARLLARSVVAYTSTYPRDRYTTFTTLTVKPVRKGDRITLTCKGQGCPVKAKTIKVSKNAKKRSLLKYLKQAKLRSGAVLQLRVTRRGTIGRVGTWKIRADKPPKVARKCVQPGAKRLSRCPGR